MATTGEKIQQFTIERAVESVDAAGQPQKTWGDVTAMLTGHGYCYGSLTPTTGTEFKRAGQITGTMSHTIGAWYFDGLLITDRFKLTNTRKKDATRTFNILFIENVGERDEEYQVFAKEAL